jgi:DNA primase
MPGIPEEKIEEIRSSINIVHYISQFVNLKKTGQNYKGLCPFHTEKTPSFIVNPEKQIFKCFGCGKGGNIYTFIMDFEKHSFVDAVKKAADFAGISLPVTEQSAKEINYFQKLYQINENACEFFEDILYKPKNEEQLNYFLKRNISEKTIKAFRLGYAPDSYDQLLGRLKNSVLDLQEAAKLGLIQEKEDKGKFYDKFRHRVMFPFQNVSGKIIGFGGRKLREEQQPKYLNSPESPVYKKGKILYGLHQAVNSIRENGFIIIVEGYFDLLRLVEEGMKNTAATSGTSLTEEQAKLLRRYTKDIYIAYDGDSAGIKAAIRNAQIIEKYDMNAFIISLPEQDDPDSFVLNNGLAAFKELLKEKTLPIDFQINAFLNTHKNPSIEQKESFIQEILSSLLEMRNQIKTGLYIHQLAERLQINESLLINQINSLKRQKYRSFRSKNKTDEQVSSTIKYGVHSGIYEAEKGLIGLLLNSSQEIQNYIIENVSYELFDNKELLGIYEFIMQELEEVGKIDLGKIIQSFQEDEESNKVISEIAVNDYINETKFAKDCIFQLKKWHLEKKAQDISALIKTEDSSTESILHYTQQLTEVRKEINQLVRIHRGILKI